QLNMQGNLFKSQLFLIKIQELHPCPSGKKLIQSHGWVRGRGTEAPMPHAPRTASACGARARAAKIPEGFLNESPKKFVWHPASNYQLNMQGNLFKSQLFLIKI
ncbi:MAG TPA: hypothetical protein PK467_01845, partial [Candidatus Wallbacteria bacterium]|nr:hypothetical protein [Candidatus Wallbacteria bacterium]